MEKRRRKAERRYERRLPEKERREGMRGESRKDKVRKSQGEIRSAKEPRESTR